MLERRETGAGAIQLAVPVGGGATRRGDSRFAPDRCARLQHDSTFAPDRLATLQHDSTFAQSRLRPNTHIKGLPPQPFARVARVAAAGECCEC